MDSDKAFSKTLKIIPDDLIFDNILPRLPVKSLLRFKSVRTTWNSVIRTPQFTKSHLQFSSSLSPHFLLQNENDIYTLSYNHHNTLKELVKLEIPWENSYIDIVGCCNGLICLSLIDNNRNCLVVWNPATRKIHTHTLRLNVPVGYEYYSSIITHGFSYCSTQGVDDYKIIASLSSQNCLWVFSLRTGLWNTIDFPSVHPFFGVQYKNKRKGIYLDHTLYWDVRVPDRISICSFSLIDEQFDQETPLMISGDEISYGDNYLSVFKGCLSFIWPRSDHNDVFVLKKEGGLTSWEKLFSIPHIFDVYFVDFAITGKCLIICYSEDIDESMFEHLCDSETSCVDLLLRPRSCELKLVDPTLEVVEHSPGISSEDGYMHSKHQYVESLVSPSSFMLM